MKKLAKYKALISTAIIGLTVYFFGKTLSQNWENLEGISLAPNAFVVIAVIFYLLSIVASGLAWGMLVKRLVGKKISSVEMIRVHLASWLLKYIPGQAGSLINKLAWSSKRGLDGKKITASFIYENIFLLLASTIPAIPILLFAFGNRFGDNQALFVPVLLAVPLAVILLTPWFFTWVMNLLFKITKKQKLVQKEMLSGLDNIKFFLIFIIPRILNGAAFVFVAKSLIDIAPSQYLVFGAIYVLAGIIGVLAIFVPSGLGVREAVIVLFASVYMPAEQAILLALISRFYATVSDIFVAGFYLLLKKTEAKI